MPAEGDKRHQLQQHKSALFCAAPRTAHLYSPTSAKRALRPVMILPSTLKVRTVTGSSYRSLVSDSKNPNRSTSNTCCNADSSDLSPFPSRTTLFSNTSFFAGLEFDRRPRSP